MKFTIKSTIPDVELGLDILGQVVIVPGSLDVDSVNAVVEEAFAAEPDVVASAGDDSGHSYVGQHSPFEGAMILQPSDTREGHSLTAQVTSASEHWHS